MIGNLFSNVERARSMQPIRKTSTLVLAANIKSAEPWLHPLLVRRLEVTTRQGRGVRVRVVAAVVHFRSSNMCVFCHQLEIAVHIGRNRRYTLGFKFGVRESIYVKTDTNPVAPSA